MYQQKQPTTPQIKWTPSNTLQRRWASERIRNRRSLSSDPPEAKTEFTRFDLDTESLLHLDRSECKRHANFKKTFMSTNILKVKMDIFGHTHSYLHAEKSRTRYAELIFFSLLFLDFLIKRIYTGRKMRRAC